MEKLFCVFAILVVFGGCLEASILKDRPKRKAGLDNLRGNGVEGVADQIKEGLGGKLADDQINLKIIEPDDEGYIRASCKFLPTNAWSAPSGTIEFKQKPGTPLDMSINLSGLSTSVSRHKVQVYTSGNIIDGCQYSGEPFIAGRYNGHLADLEALNSNGEVQLEVSGVSATLLGRKSIFGRVIKITSDDGKESEACCIIVHESVRDLVKGMKPSTVQLGKANGPNFDADEEGWSSVLDALHKEAENMDIDPNTITNIINLSKAQGGLGSIGENTKNSIDPRFMEAVYEEAKRNGINPDTIIKVEDMGDSNEQGTGDMNGATEGQEGSSWMTAIYEQAERDGIDPNSITDVEDLGNDSIEYSSENNNEQDIEGAIYKEAERQGINPKAITKVVDLGNATDSKELHGELNGEYNGEYERQTFIDEVYKQAEKNGIDSKTISNIVDLSESKDLTRSSALTKTLNGMSDALMPDMLDAMKKAAKEKNIPLEAISKIVDLSKDPDNHDIVAFQKAGIKLVGNSKLDLKELQDLGVGQGLESGETGPSMEDILNELRNQGISEQSIIKIVDIPDSTEVDVNDLAVSDNMEGMANDEAENMATVASEGEGDDMPGLVKELEKQANDSGIPTGVITDIIDQGQFTEDGENNFINQVVNLANDNRMPPDSVDENENTNP